MLHIKFVIRTFFVCYSQFCISIKLKEVMNYVTKKLDINYKKYNFSKCFPPKMPQILNKFQKLSIPIELLLF